MSERKQTDFDILIEHDIDLRARTLYLRSEIDDVSTNKFIKLLRYLDKTSGDITIILDTNGGNILDGLAIYDSIRACDNEVTIRVIGAAFSIGSIILQAGDKRSMSSHSRLMVHIGSVAVEGHTVDAKRYLEEVHALDDICIDIYLNKIKQAKPHYKRADLKKLMQHDTYMSSVRCLEMGLIDSID
jgi:ATP-dependent Clp protease protease subunit